MISRNFLADKKWKMKLQQESMANLRPISAYICLKTEKIEKES